MCILMKVRGSRQGRELGLEEKGVSGIGGEKAEVKEEEVGDRFLTTFSSKLNFIPLFII